MGDGSSVRFWHDLWCGELPLKEISPELYAISRNRDASVIELLSFLGDSYHWNVSFNHCFKNRTGPAGPTGNRELVRSG